MPLLERVVAEYEALELQDRADADQLPRRKLGLWLRVSGYLAVCPWWSR
jgi:hypothetical protein